MMVIHFQNPAREMGINIRLYRLLEMVLIGLLLTLVIGCSSSNKNPEVGRASSSQSPEQIITILLKNNEFQSIAVLQEKGIDVQKISEFISVDLLHKYHTASKIIAQELSANLADSSQINAASPSDYFVSAVNLTTFRSWRSVVGVKEVTLSANTNSNNEWKRFNIQSDNDMPGKEIFIYVRYVHTSDGVRIDDFRWSSDKKTQKEKLKILIKECKDSPSRIFSVIDKLRFDP